MVTTSRPPARGAAADAGDAPASRFDLELFLALNEEYAGKPLVPAPRRFDPWSLRDQAGRRAEGIGRRVDLGGRRVLEVGAGRGDLGRALVERYGCEYVGVDVTEYREWAGRRTPGVTLVRRDVSTEPHEDLGQFDVVVSLAVLEHVVHPHAMLRAMHDLLRPGGTAYLAANLYRGPKASHRYRDVYFPWPHLLFAEPVWRRFYREVHGKDDSFAWVNKLTYAQYLVYFDQVGLTRDKVWLTPSTFDADLYRRFEDVLSAYPVFDLSHDFVYALLRRPSAAPPHSRRGPAVIRDGEVARLRREVEQLRGSTSWRVTAPLRAATDAARRARRRARR